MADLFDKNIAPCCKYCARSKKLADEDDMLLCSKYGVVSVNYACKAFKYNPVKRTPAKRQMMEYFDEDFDIDNNQ